MSDLHRPDIDLLAPPTVPKLHSLGLNCMLAALVPAGIALTGMIMAWQSTEERIAAVRLASQCEALHTWARLESKAQRPAGAVWMTLDPTWQALAEIRLEDGQMRVSQQVGKPLLGLDGTSPPAWVTEAMHRPRGVWVDAQTYAVAAPLFGTDEQALGLLYGEGKMAATNSYLWLSGLSVGLLGFSVLMAWYLVRRISKPVKEIQEMAERAIRGEVVHGDNADASQETAALRSSVARLAARASTIGRQGRESSRQAVHKVSQDATHTAIKTDAEH